MLIWDTATLNFFDDFHIVYQCLFYHQLSFVILIKKYLASTCALPSVFFYYVDCLFKKIKGLSFYICPFIHSFQHPILHSSHLLHIIPALSTCVRVKGYQWRIYECTGYNLNLFVVWDELYLYFTSSVGKLDLGAEGLGMEKPELVKIHCIQQS